MAEPMARLREPISGVLAYLDLHGGGSLPPVPLGRPLSAALVVRGIETVPRRRPCSSARATTRRGPPPPPGSRGRGPQGGGRAGGLQPVRNRRHRHSASSRDAQDREGVGGGRCVCHGTPAPAAGADGAEQARREGELASGPVASARRRGTGAARGRPGRAARAGAERARAGRGGGWSSPDVGPRRRRVRRPKPVAARPTGLLTSSGPARAATSCSPRTSRRASSRPAGAEVVLAGTADRGEALSGVGGHGSRLRGQPVSPPPRPFRATTRRRARRRRRRLQGHPRPTCHRPAPARPRRGLRNDTGGRVSSSRGRAGDPGLVDDLQLTG